MHQPRLVTPSLLNASARYDNLDYVRRSEKNNFYGDPYDNAAVLFNRRVTMFIHVRRPFSCRLSLGWRADLQKLDEAKGCSGPHVGVEKAFRGCFGRRSGGGLSCVHIYVVVASLLVAPSWDALAGPSWDAPCPS